MKTFTSLSFLLVTLFFVSCTKDRLTADGNITSEIRKPGTFSGVRSSGSTPVHIQYGTEYQVELRGSGNLIPVFRTSVSGGTLNLAYEHVNVHRDDLQIFVTMPVVSHVSLSGSGDLDISGNFPQQDSFEARISGSGSIVVNDPFDSNSVNTDISGSGGSDLQKIRGKQVEARVSGSGSARVNAQNALKVRISGSGKVYYSGNPVVDSEISGSGKVVRL